MSGLHIGHVTSFDAHVGTGIVTSEAGKDWMFHLTAIADGTRMIEAGQRVAFVVEAGGPGQWEAKAVTKL